MKGGDQTRKEVSTQTTNLLTPKSPFVIGCWNVRTLYQTGKLAQVLKEMKQYKINILGITESRWTETGKRKLGTGETIIWSGRTDGHHKEGVALIIKKEHTHTLLKWEPINERLLYTRFNSKFAKLSVIVCYAPTEDAEDEIKDKFYESLQAIIAKIPKHDVLMIIGDFNAQVGNDNRGRERVMGKHGIGIKSNNGERLCEFSETNDVVIGGTLFPHRRIHKATWRSPDGHTENQIDHILINGKWRHSLQDVKVRRLADVGSDHNLVIGKLALKLRKAKVGEQRQQRFDITKLQNPETKQKFKLALKNNFSLLQEETEMTIHKFNEAIKLAGENILGYRKSKKEEWISTATWDKIEQRKEIKKRLLSTKSPRLKEKIAKEFSQKNREVKSGAKVDRRMYVEKLATEAEEAAMKNDLKSLYTITKKLRGNMVANQDLPLKAEDGKAITGEREKIERWKEHFQQLLNRPSPAVPANIVEAGEDLDIDIQPISEEEVKEAIRAQKKNKAPGKDGVCAEMLMVEEAETPRLLCKILNDIWDKEIIPEEWRIGSIIKLPKKGDLGNCNNWRGITLLSLTSKIFSRVILQRMNIALDNKIRIEQAGFRKGRSCIDHIFALRQIVEQSNEWNSSIYMVFVDFEKAFDSLHRESLWKILRHYGIPLKMVSVIKALYTDFHCQVVCNNQLTEYFEVSTGVRQGCILSPFLFNLAMDWLMRETIKDNNRGIRWTLTSVLEDLDYADDIGLLASRYEDAQRKLDILSRTAQTIGLKINIAKTKVMRNNHKFENPIVLQNEVVEEVQDFVYLGSTVSPDGDSEKDITEKIKKARQTFAMLNKIWKAKGLNLRTKLKIYRSNVLGVLLYSSECWKMTQSIIHKLETFQNKCLRRILQIFWPNTITNEELLKRTECASLETIIKRRRWRWFGHVCRMPAGALARTALKWTADGKRRPGRPKETWRRTVERELKECGLTWETVGRKAAERQQWKSLVEALCVNRDTKRI